LLKHAAAIASSGSAEAIGSGLPCAEEAVAEEAVTCVISLKHAKTYGKLIKNQNKPYYGPVQTLRYSKFFLHFSWQLLPPLPLASRRCRSLRDA
jgi:hypothetical protein